LISGAAVMNAAFNGLPDDVKKSGFGWNGVSKEAPAGAVKAEAQKETDIINITATAATPDAAVAMANATAQAYFDTDMNQKISEVKRVEKTVNSELITQRDRYNDALASLAAFQRSSNLIDLETMQHSFSQSWLDARTQIDMKESQLGAAQNAANDIRRRLLSTPATLPGTTQTSRNPEYEAAYGQLLTYRKDLDDARRQYTPESDTVRRAQKAVDDQQKIVDSLPRTVTNTTESVRNPQADQLRNDLNAQLTLSASLQREIGKDRETLSARASDVKNFPEKQRQYAVLKEKVDVNYQTYSTLAAQSNKLAVAEVTAQPTGHIGALATPPSKPSAPNVPILIGAAAFIGLMLGIVAVSIAETADKRLRDPMFAEKSYGIPTLSTIPYVQGLRAGTRMPIIGEVPGSAAFLEGFRYLRNNILFSMPNRRMKLLAITSPSPADGKSTVSLNLAVAMGMDGKRVLVVDVDLRRPSLHHFANAANDKGFTTLVDGATLADCVVGTPYRNVHVLPSGPLPVDPTEFLNSSRCREAIAKL
ncbi:MAG TPA: AAA family ATPase, partial [Fimbriimonas sp.]|nr:AAA family ATPase [Fimbriimonas sp.]